MTAELFDAAEAKHIGLLHDVVEDLDEHRKHLEKALNMCSPRALGGSKELIDQVANRPITDELRKWTATRLADVRESVDGQEGMSAFIEKAENQAGCVDD